MSHEATPNGEPTGGPEFDDTLPDAGAVPVTQDPTVTDPAVPDDDGEQLHEPTETMRFPGSGEPEQF